MRNITKAVFLNSVSCMTLGWYGRADERTEGLAVASTSLGDQFLMEQGLEVGRRARLLFPQGILVTQRDIPKAAEETSVLMRDPKVTAIFEATFVVGEYVAKADVLVRNGKRWRLIEVKMSMSLRPQLITDLAYTFMVLVTGDVDLSGASLLLVSREYRLAMDDKTLMAETDCTLEVLGVAAKLAAYWEPVRAATGGAVKPGPVLIKECKNCSVFMDCMGKGIENHILDIPRLSAKKFENVLALGLMRVEDIPEDFELTANQSRVRDAVKSGTPWISENLSAALAGIHWPAFYLDFETVMTAIPLYEDIAPYTQIVFQYSIHKCGAGGVAGMPEVSEHREYLADPTKHDRRALAKRLLEDLGEEGSIITYSAFEKTVVNGLAKLFPDLSVPLGSLVGRMVDLEAIIRENCYHPKFHGRTSLKVTLPTLVPTMTYKGLAIGDGASAFAAFAYVATGKYIGEEAERAKKNLLIYCGQDTLAMVEVHKRLVAYSLA